MSIISIVTQVLAGAQTEIALFFLAVCAHMLLFGKHRVGGGKSGKLRVAKSVPEAAKLPCSPSERARTSAFEAFGPLLRAVKQVLKEGSGREALMHAISEGLRGLSPQRSEEALLALLEGVGRNQASSEFLGAIRAIISELRLQLSTRLGEDLLRAYLRTPAANKHDFEEVLREVEKAGVSSPTIHILAFRAALSSSDLESALCRLRGIADTWRVPGAVAASPSAAPKSLLQQLLRLAAEQGDVRRIIAELRQLELIASWSIEVVFVDCAQRGDAEAIAECEAIANAQGLELTAPALAALLRVAAHKVAESGKGAAAVDAAVLEFYEMKCSSANILSVDAAAGLLVAEASIRSNRQDLLKRMLLACPDEPRLVGLLKSLGSAGHLTSAQEVFKICPVKSSCLHNALLDICIACGDSEAAGQVMDEAVNAGVADAVTYNTIIKASLQSGSPHKARKALEAMRSAGIAPTCVTFNELLDASVRSDLDGGWAIIDEMKACGLQPNQVTCSILLKSICRNSRPADVERTLAVVDALDTSNAASTEIGSDTQDTTIDEILFSSVCEACIRANRSDLLMKQLKQRLHGSKRVQIQGAHAFGSLIRAYGYIQDLGGVRKTWNDMRSRQVVPTSITLGCMVEALVTNNDIEAGYELIRDMMSNEQTRPLVNAVIYCSVLKGFSHQKRFSRVWEIQQEMTNAKLQFSVVTYNALIDACARSGEIHRIQPLLEEMASQKIKPNIITYSTIIKGYCQENRLDNAFEMLEDMKQTSGMLPDEITYNTLLDGCARHGLYDRGMALLEEMQGAGVKPTNFTLSVLVKLANRSKRPEVAFRLCEEISRKYGFRLNMHVYNNLIQSCTLQRNIPAAFEILERMFSEKIRADVRTYTLLMRGCIHTGDLDGAVGLVRAATGLRGAHPRIVAFGAHAIRPSGNLSAELLAEVLEGLAERSSEESLAVQLVKDLSHVPGLKLDPKLQLRVTSKAMHLPGN